MKKRVITLILAAMLTLSACGTTAQPEATTTTPVETTSAADTTAPDAQATETTEEKSLVTNRVVEGDTTGLTPAVWQVTDPESGNSLKMMGTIHLIPETSSPVPQYVMDIYNESDGIAVEYDISRVQLDMVVQIKYLSYFVLGDGTLITDHLTPENYEGVKARLTEYGMYNEAFDAYNANYWESLLTSAAVINIDGMQETGIDSYFIGIAKEDGKEVRDIEELETQMNALTASTDEMCNYSISEMLTLTDEEFEEDFMELYNMWATGDVDAYVEMDSEGMEEYPEELLADYEHYNDLMITQRNIGMAEQAAEYIENGDNIFYMVGFAHFCGDGNVIDLLEEQGYTVERIY